MIRNTTTTASVGSTSAVVGSGDQQSNRRIVIPACPCCQFIPDDLFMPLPQPTNAHDNENATTTTESSHHLTEVLTPRDAFTHLIKASTSTTMHPSKSDSEPTTGSTKRILLVDTHGHAHLERTQEEAEEQDTGPDADTRMYRVLDYPKGIDLLPMQDAGHTKEASADDDDAPSMTDKVDIQYASLTCAVAPEDWDDCLEYASRSAKCVPAIGIHPWYLANLPLDWYERLEFLLQKHTGCMVGEIGLCKQARFLRTYEEGKQAALELQRSVFARQLDLAAQYQRGVTIHCVNQHGVLMETLKEKRTPTDLPPVIAMHSFTGTAHHVQQLLQWEETLYSDGKEKKTRRSKKKQQQEQDTNQEQNNLRRSTKEDNNVKPTRLPLLYFGFSHMVNCAMCSSEKSRRQGRAAIQAVPPDRLLAESDVHCTKDLVGGTVGAIAYLAWALDESIESITERTTKNGIAFLQRAYIQQ